MARRQPVRRRCCWCRSAARRGPRTSCRSWRTSPAAAASRASGSRRSGEHYYLFGGRSPINDLNRALLAALRADLPAAGIDLPVYWGNRNWDPYLTDARRRRWPRDGVDPGRLLRHQRLLVVVELPAVPREPLRRGRRRRPVRPGSTSCGTTSTTRASWSRWSTRSLAALADLPDGVRDGARLVFVTHSIPTSMNDGSGPDGGAYVAQHRDVAAVVAERVRQETGRRRARTSWSSARAPAPPQVPWLEPDVNDHLEELRGRRVRAAVVLVPVGFVSDHMEVVYDLDTEALATAETARPPEVRRAATAGHDPRFVAMVRDLLLERAAVERGEEPRPVRRVGETGPLLGPLPGGLLPQPARRAARARRRADREPDAAALRRRSPSTPPGRPPSWSGAGPRRASTVAATKSSDVDVVTEADRAAEALIRDRLLARPPRRRASSARRATTCRARPACAGSSTRSTAP